MAGEKYKPTHTLMRPSVKRDLKAIVAMLGMDLYEFIEEAAIEKAKNLAAEGKIPAELAEFKGLA